jgi:hypothetical protein
MKRILRCGVLLSALLASASATALEPLVLYDDFNAKSLDAGKWLGQQSGTLLDIAREIHGNRLRLAARSPAIPPLPGGAGATANRLRLAFPNPAAVEAIDASVVVRNVDASGCPVNSVPSRAALRLSGIFFKTEPAGGGVNDVLALIRIERSTANNDPEGVMRVQGILFHCTDAGCNTANTLSAHDLGFLEVGQKTRLRVQWDKLLHQFVFQRDDQPEVLAPYAVFDDLPPALQTKRIEIAHDVANCPVPGASTAYMEAFVNDVLVNASAASGP